jgi:hypothetical protein
MTIITYALYISEARDRNICLRADVCVPGHAGAKGACAGSRCG